MLRARIRLVLFVSICFHFSEAVLAPTVKLNDGTSMPALALGTWLGHNSQGRIQPKGREVEDAVTWAIESGYRHIDTAYIYGVEDQVGRALANCIERGIVTREDLFVTTKLWNDRHAQEAVVPALRESLHNLNLSYIDLYLIHWPVGQFANKSYDNTDYLETYRGMLQAQQLGLTRSVGVSNFNQHQIERIIKEGLATPAVLQVELNLNLQQPSLLSYCKEHHIAVTGYTPFGSLFYSKAKADAPPPRIDDPSLVDIANKYNKTVPQVALRYLVELGVVPLPKSVTKSRIEQNIAIFDFQLSQQEKDLLASYDKNYRTLPQVKWIDHPYYPFEKN